MTQEARDRESKILTGLDDEPTRDIVGFKLSDIRLSRIDSERMKLCFTDATQFREKNWALDEVKTKVWQADAAMTVGIGEDGGYVVESLEYYVARNSDSIPADYVKMRQELMPQEDDWTGCYDE